MDSYISPGLSFLPSSQQTLAKVEPLSADFLKYQLSRTPTLKRFSRNVNRPPRARLDAKTPRNDGNLSLNKADFRPASEPISQDVAAEADDRPSRIAKRWPAPRHVAAAWTSHEGGSVDSTAKYSPDSDGNVQMLQKTHTRVATEDSDDFTLNDAIREAGGLLKTHAVASHSSGGPAEKAVLKRPTKSHPLPSAPPVHQQRAALAEVQVNRQFSIPDDELPGKAKKQKRPRIARNLPVDGLELAEERVVLPYDAHPMSASDECDSDPIEEPPVGRVRRPRNPKNDNIRPVARLTKKQVPARSALLVGTNEKKTWQLSDIGDGFDGSERLPTGRKPHGTKARRRPRQQSTRATLYYKALEIVESKTYEVGFLGRQDTPPHAGPAAPGFEIAHHEMEDAVAFAAAVSGDLFMEGEYCPALPVDADKVVKTIELDAMDVKQDIPKHLDPQTIKMSTAQESHAEISLPDVSFQAIKMDLELAHVPDEEEEEMDMEGYNDVQSDQDVNDAHYAEAPQDMSWGMQTDSAPQVRDLLPKHPGQMQEPGLPPLARLIAKDGKRRPVTTKIKRQVTFSEKVKIQTVVEPESEEEYESEPEQQSQASDSESDKSQSTDSEAEKSHEDDDDSNDSDGDADDEDDDDEEGGGYSTTKFENRVGSPELVSSGYYVRSSSPGQPHISFNACETQSVALNPADDDILEDGIMMLDVDDEINELPELPESPQYTPQYTPQSRKYLEEIADSEDEILILTPRFTSAERVVPGSEGVVGTEYCEEDKSDDLDTHSRPSEDVHEPADIPSARGSGHNLTRPATPFFGVARFLGGVQTNFADSAVAMTPQNTHASFAAFEQSRGSQTALISPSSVFRKIRRAKTGLQQHGGPPIRKISVRDVPSYFIQASQALSSPQKNVQVMMRRARTLPSTEYVSESGDEEGFIISDGSFRERLQGRKRHLSLSDSMKDRDNVGSQAE